MNIYQSLYENSMDAVFLAATDGGVLAANPAACELFRMEEEEICRAGRSGLVDTSSPQYEHFHEERKRTGRACGELILVRGDGTRFWGEVTAAQYAGEDDEPRMVLVVRDLTERKRIEQELEESQALLNAVVDSTVDMIWSVDAESFALLSFNQSRYDHFLHQRGIRLEKGMHLEQMYPGKRKRQKMWHAYYLRALREGSFSTEHVSYEGNIALQLNFNVLKRDGGVFGISVFGKNITKRQQAENRAALMNFALNNVSEVAFLVDEHARFHFANEEASRALGYSCEELLGMGVGDIDPDFPAEHWSGHWQVLKERKSITFEGRHQAKDGRIFPVEINANFIEYGEQQYHLTLVRDITDRKRTEVKLYRLNRELRAISDCNQAILHAEDERTLLTEICQIICEKSGYRMAWVGIAEQGDDKRTRPVAWAGDEGEYLAGIEVSWAADQPSGQGPTGMAIRSGKTVYVQDIATDPCMRMWRERALQRGYCSSIALPLKAENGEVFGVLTIYSSDHDAFIPEEIRLLEGLAEDMTFGVGVLRTRAEHGKAEEALRDSTEKLDRSNRELRRLTARREEIREQERMYIARNVHDELGQLLTSLQLKISTIELGFGKENPRLEQELKYAQELVDKSLRVARNVVSALRPASLDMGVAASMEWLAQRYSGNTGIECDVWLSNWRDELVDEAGVIALYRIAQESLTNVARYANASHVVIILKGFPDHYQMIVRDKGVGFDPKEAKEGAFGLMGIRERVIMLGGEFTINTAKGAGTELLVNVPIATTGEAI